MLNPGITFQGAAGHLLLGARCSGQEYQPPEKVGFGSSVHGCLELFDAVHGAFDRPELYCSVSPAVTASRLGVCAPQSPCTRGHPGNRIGHRRALNYGSITGIGIEWEGCRYEHS